MIDRTIGVRKGTLLANRRDRRLELFQFLVAAFRQLAAPSIGIEQLDLLLQAGV